MTGAPIVRPERRSDRNAIHAIHAASFPTDAEARLVDALRQAGRLAVSLVAEVDGEVVGHVAFSPVTVDGADGGLGLAPLAVRDAYRCRGIADRLVREGLEACRRAGAALVVVLGDPGYYGRFGFEPAGRWGLCDEYGGEDAFQAIELVASERPVAAGLLRYAPEFAAVG